MQRYFVITAGQFLNELVVFEAQPEGFIATPFKKYLKRVQAGECEIKIARIAGGLFDYEQNMLNEWNEFQDQEDRVKILMRNIQDDRIDALCREYLNHTDGMSDKEFEDKFRIILSENSRAAKLI